MDADELYRSSREEIWVPITEESGTLEMIIDFGCNRMEPAFRVLSKDLFLIQQEDDDDDNRCDVVCCEKKNCCLHTHVMV